MNGSVRARGRAKSRALASKGVVRSSKRAEPSTVVEPHKRLRDSLGLGSRSRANIPGPIPIRAKTGLSQEEFARLTGYSVRAIAGIEAGKAPSAPVRRKLKEISRLLSALSELMPAEQVAAWLGESNDAFNGHAPFHLVERGESDQIWEMIHQIDANVAN